MKDKTVKVTSINPDSRSDSMFHVISWPRHVGWIYMEPNGRWQFVARNKYGSYLGIVLQGKVNGGREMVWESEIIPQIEAYFAPFFSKIVKIVSKLASRN